jgi:hypothetical protein
MNTAIESQRQTPEPTEIGTLAREMARRYRAHVEDYKERCGLSTEEAIAKVEARGAPEYEERLAQRPADEFSWLDMRIRLTFSGRISARERVFRGGDFTET